MKEYIFPILIVFGVITVVAVVVGYNAFKDYKNRELYLECLRVSERMANSDNRQGVRIVSTPHCWLSR